MDSNEVTFKGLDADPVDPLDRRRRQRRQALRQAFDAALGGIPCDSVALASQRLLDQARQDGELAIHIFEFVMDALGQELEAEIRRHHVEELRLEIGLGKAMRPITV
jgi:hypothetical protein